MLEDMTDDCTNDYCLNGGSCHDDFLGKTCYCPNEYTATGLFKRCTNTHYINITPKCVVIITLHHTS